MGNNYQEYLERKSRQAGTRFDASNLAPQFIPYFESQQRIEVEFRRGPHVLYYGRGRVGVTTGWKPVFILMPRIDSIGSSEVLGDDDKIVKVIPERGRK
jgi:hypothetical protein